LRVARDCNHVQHENQQIIRLPGFRRQRFVVNNFKVDESRPAGFVVIYYVVRSGIAVRPWSPKLIARELMSAPEFAASCFDHSTCESTLFQMLP
jgi:hypothetical protein